MGVLGVPLGQSQPSLALPAAPRRASCCFARLRSAASLRTACSTHANARAPSPLPPQHTTKVLRIHASSEDDPFFLHTLEVSEEDFQGLKADQGILVDFGNFPGKIISLLERCLASQTADMPRFQVCVCGEGGSSGRLPEDCAAAVNGQLSKVNGFQRSNCVRANPNPTPIHTPPGRPVRQGRRQRLQGRGDQRLQAAAAHHAHVPPGQRHGRQAGAAAFRALGAPEPLRRV
jgi:hypothetical protein